MTALDTTSVPAPLPGAAAPAAQPPVRFTGATEAYVWILIRGYALLGVTLGIYRFWLNTDVRRFLWSKTEVAGESLEYTGTAIELLIGFLIGLAILIPLYVVFFIGTLSMGPIGQFVSAFGFLILLVFGQFAIYRARRYRLTRTVYRGVRFYQTGSATLFAFYATMWFLLTAITLGIAYPFMQAQLERFRMRNTHYGNLHGRFVGSGFKLFLRGIGLWLLIAGPPVLALAASIALIDWPAFIAAVDIEGGDEAMEKLGSIAGVKQSIIFLSSAAAISVIVGFFVYPVFQATVLRWWLSGLRLGELAFTSRLQTKRIYGAYARFIGISLLYSMAGSIAFGIVAILFTMIFGSPEKSIILQFIAIVLSIGFYVVFMLGFSVIYRATVQLSTWRLCVLSLDFQGLAVLDTVRAEGTPSSAVGEGLADALNVGGI